MPFLSKAGNFDCRTMSFNVKYAGAPNAVDAIKLQTWHVAMTGGFGHADAAIAKPIRNNS
jgi:hypothetical protein